MELSIRNGGSVQVSDDVFGRDFNEDLVHQVVTAYLAAGRQGTRAHKNRAAVSGGGKKPWRQKGTGRARAGTIRGPIWRGGGVTFAAKPQDHGQKVNKKMYRAAVQTILSELARQERLLVVDSLSISEPKTKLLVGQLADLGAKEALIITEGVDSNLFLASRNLVGVNVCDVDAIDPVSLVAYDKVVVTVAALKKFEEVLG